MTELARNLHLSPTTVQSRIKRLELNHVVAGCTINGPDGLEVSLIPTCVLVTLAPRRSAAIEVALRGIADTTSAIVLSTHIKRWSPDSDERHSSQGKHQAGHA